MEGEAGLNDIRQRIHWGVSHIIYNKKMYSLVEVDLLIISLLKLYLIFL